MNLILIPINNSYYMFNFLWTNIGGTALIAYKTPTNVISSVSFILCNHNAWSFDSQWILVTKINMKSILLIPISKTIMDP